MTGDDLFEDQPTETPSPPRLLSLKDASDQGTADDYIEKLKEILVEKGVSDREVSTKMQKVQSSVNWSEFLDILHVCSVPSDLPDNSYYQYKGVRESDDRSLLLRVLHSPLTRHVQVYKDASPHPKHREYTTDNDTILEIALRRSPPQNVLDFLSEASQSYRFSRNLFDQIDATTIEDEQWLDVDAMLKQIVQNQKDINEQKVQVLMKEICEIRHTWREDTLLSIATRREPPVYIMKKLLSYAPETIHFRDTPRYDWIPLVYALAYNAIPEVVNVLIPSTEILTKTEVLISEDVYDLTPLHWSLFYGAPVKVVQSLVDADISDGKKSLYKTNNKNEMPFEKAITASTDMAIIEVLLPPDENIQDIEKVMVRSVIGLQSKISPGIKEYTVSPRTYDSLAKAITKKPYLQRMLRYKSSESVATAIMVSECYAKIAFIVAFHHLSTTYLLQQYQLEEAEAEQKRTFFRANMLIEEELVSFVLLCIALAYTIFREVHQIINAGLTYVTSLWNWFDLLFIFLSIFSMSMMLHLVGGASPSTFDEETSREIILITSSIAWANLLFFIRSIFLPFAVFVSGLLGVFRKLIPFTLGVMIILFAFAQLYVTENVGTPECNDGERGDLCLFDSAFLKVYGMFVGGIDISELSNTPSMLIISAMFGFIVVILLLNIVIAIVSDEWSEVYTVGELHYWRNRLDFLAEVKHFDRTFACFKGSRETNNIHSSKGKVGTISRMPHNVVEKICQLLWPRPDFWGHFDHIIERVLSTKPLYGSFLWQFQNEWENAELLKRIVMSIKAIFLILFFSVVCMLWFVAGVLSFGIFWPKSMRRFLLGHFIESDAPDKEEQSSPTTKNQARNG